MDEPARNLLTVSEAAARLLVSSMTVRRMIARREIRAARVGRQWRLPVSEVERLEAPVMFTGAVETPSVVAVTLRPRAVTVSDGPTDDVQPIRIFADRSWETVR